MSENEFVDLVLAIADTMKREEDAGGATPASSEQSAYYIRQIAQTDRPTVDGGSDSDNNFQVRIRIDDEFQGIKCIEPWLDATKAGFAFQHKKPDNNHYHIYLFGLQRAPDAMRRLLGRNLPSKECYAVSSTCGKKVKRKLDPQGAYNYGTTRYLVSPVWFKGYTADEMKKFADEAKKFWDKATAANTIIVEKAAKTVRVPYQQLVIADASADWFNYKRKCRDEGEDIEQNKVVDFVCAAMRRHGRGINVYLVKEMSNAILYDDEDLRARLLSKIKAEVKV